jgi:hypothetical protein
MMNGSSGTERKRKKNQLKVWISKRDKQKSIDTKNETETKT